MIQSAIVVDPRKAVHESLQRHMPALRALLAPFGGDANARAVRMARIVLDSLDRNPLLLQSHPPSIVSAVIQSAELGLEIGGPLGEAYLVPFWNNRLKRKECQCIPGYKGLIKLAYDEPRISGVDTDVVYAADEWKEIRGTAPQLVHLPRRGGDRGERVCAYAIIFKREGPPTFAVMSADEIRKIKAESLSKMKEQWQRDASPWTVHEDEMWKKSALRRVVKLVPLSSALRSALELDAQEYGDVRPDRKGRAEALKEKLGAVKVDVEVIDEIGDEDK
jgi:recombination protein RecT